MPRLQITVSDEVAHNLDICARDIGISRNALCAVFLHQGIQNHNQVSMDSIHDIVLKIIEEKEGVKADG